MSSKTSSSAAVSRQCLSWGEMGRKMERKRFLNRKGTVWTKASELNTLCDAPVMIVLKKEDGTFDTWPPLDSAEFNSTRSMYYRYCKINGKKFQPTKAVAALNLKKKGKTPSPSLSRTCLEEESVRPPPATENNDPNVPPSTANNEDLAPLPTTVDLVSLPQVSTIPRLSMIQLNHQSYSYGMPMPRWNNSDYGWSNSDYGMCQ